MPDIVTSGWHTTDDIVLEDGTCIRAVDGGGAVYSAVGARVWSRSVGIHAPVGARHAKRIHATLRGHGFSTDGMRTIPGNGMELWILHESGDYKQQIVKHGSASPAELDAQRGPLPDSYSAALGVHIAPQGPESGRATAHDLAGSGKVVTMDILSDTMIDARAYADLGFLDDLTAFLPSEAEVRCIWSPASLAGWASAAARAHDCHVVVKLGAKGALVAEAGSGLVASIDALPVAVADTTGAGDAFCGGFLVGLVAKRPPGHCAAMGTVSAGFVIEACGALATDHGNRARRDRLFDAALATLRFDSHF